MVTPPEKCDYFYLALEFGATAPSVPSEDCDFYAACKSQSSATDGNNP